MGVLHELIKTSYINYCSSTLAGVSGVLLQRLQSVLNAAAQLVFSARRSEHITPLLRELHWLKVPERIQIRLCVLTHRCLHGTAPPYLAETLQLTADVQGRRRLRSASTTTLVVPPTRRATIGIVRFRLLRRVPGIPFQLRAGKFSHCLRFRRKLKTELFAISFLAD